MSLDSSSDLSKLYEQAQAASRLLKALANPDRLLLLCHLVEQESHVSDLEQQLGIVQPTLSQQLAVLRREGLVSTRREGKQIYYRIASPVAQALLETLHQHFCSDSN
ncbi:DNA-binding transcriptional ArsR family regulator [Azomonas agilis]|uniref:DNA-binding transcriptional ArsR family regulator n=1 Tax=Azomonas agilis TaxID=116849 RepID=A0A562IZS0_9GAMM|nr:metalloregulator ArsR/SmtB family transcription factor [Azomonas agilis]TWH76350.1 DNA-binding transcriptional ArsR family regulator [Azomonas agilis]